MTYSAAADLWAAIARARKARGDLKGAATARASEKCFRGRARLLYPGGRI